MLTNSGNELRDLLSESFSSSTDCRAAYVIAGQLVRAGTSVGANYRSACRARSRADFIAKLKIVEEECDESLYWLELFDETGQKGRLPVTELMKEADELLSMVVASIKTARSPT